MSSGSFLDLHSGSLALDPMVNPSETVVDSQPEPSNQPEPLNQPDHANGADNRPLPDRLRLLDPPEPRATRRRRVVNLAEGRSAGIA